MGTFNIDVKVFEQVGDVLRINVNPETILLDGLLDTTITWTMRTPETAHFVDNPVNPDIQFTTANGREHFSVRYDSPTQMSATVVATNDDQTIYTYYLTVHLANYPVAIMVDPEVDNPPPPPGP